MKTKIFRWIANILTSLCILIGIFSFIAILQSNSGQEHPPSIFNHQVMSVLSGSMEPRIEPGDLIVIKKVDRAKVGDVITYRKSSNTFVTHRVTEIVQDNGTISYRTKGDANNVEDQELVRSEQLIGTLSFHIPNGGHVIHFVRSPLGIITVLLFMILVMTIWKTLRMPTYTSKKEDSRSSLSNGEI